MLGGFKMSNENAADLNVGLRHPRPSLSLVTKRRALVEDQYECLVGISPQVAALKEFIAVQASHTQPVLFVGERGLRQEQIARALHEASEQWDQPFFAVNAHSLSSEALHGLLFSPQGVIETLKHGTIYINELTGLPILLQQRFAAYLEEQRWQGRASRYARQRLVFSTEFNPNDRTAENRLAYGLVELLRPTSFTLKPLRERSEDLPQLANFLLARIARRHGEGVCEITAEAMRLLSEYTWERNIDELEAVLEGAVSALPPQRIDEGLLPPRIRHAHLRSIPADGIDLPGIVDQFEWTLIETALKQSGGSQTKASRLLGLRVQTLNMKLKRYDEQGRSLRHVLAE